MKSRLQPLPICDLARYRPFYHKVNRVTADSRLVKQGDLFLAYQGHHTDGRYYIAEAVNQGASVVFWEDDAGFCWNSDWLVDHLPVKQLAQQAGIIVADILHYPSQAMRIIGVTGTNGKTSITHWLAQAYGILEKKAALIGTVGNGFLGQLSNTTHTTPDAITMQQLLAHFAHQSAKVVAIEVSSHALDQGRVNGVPFETAIFTNLTRDHLDYHQTMQAYGYAKSQLFYWESLRYAIINVADQFGYQLAAQLKQQTVQLLTYGLEQGDIHLTACHVSKDGMVLDIHTPWGDTQLANSLIGRFNISNVLACLAALCVDNVPLSQARDALSVMEPVYGRMQRLGGKNKPLVVIDYAHTPDALQAALKSLSELRTKQGKLYCVFGCGGDRDTGKRPMMGRIVEKNADVSVVTSDNPRTEASEHIVQDIVSGMHHVSHIEVDRALAIEWAIRHATAKDIVLIAGKGHEQYQDIGGYKLPFSDFSIAEQVLFQGQQS